MQISFSVCKAFSTSSDTFLGFVESLVFFLSDIRHKIHTINLKKHLFVKCKMTNYCHWQSTVHNIIIFSLKIKVFKDVFFPFCYNLLSLSERLQKIKSQTCNSIPELNKNVVCPISIDCIHVFPSPWLGSLHISQRITLLIKLQLANVNMVF